MTEGITACSLELQAGPGTQLCENHPGATCPWLQNAQFGQRNAGHPEQVTLDSADETTCFKPTSGGKAVPVTRTSIGIVVVLLILTIIIITLAVIKGQPCHCQLHPPPDGYACPDFWIGYQGKCFYVSEEERNWIASANNCSSFNASLAVITTQKELNFWVKFSGTSHYWLGLSREGSEVWKWQNATGFENQFPVRGEGRCAYIDEKGISSTMCSMEKYFLCSQPEACITRSEESNLN